MPVVRNAGHAKALSFWVGVSVSGKKLVKKGPPDHHPAGDLGSFRITATYYVPG